MPRRIAALYDILERLQPTPIVRLNRAVAIGMAEGPAAGLALLDGRGAGGAGPQRAAPPDLQAVQLDGLDGLPDDPGPADAGPPPGYQVAGGVRRMLGRGQGR